MAPAPPPTFYFEGFEQANTTPVPDVLFDRLLAKLGEAELKALLYIIRRTKGFKKDTDPISFNQFLRGIRTRDGRVLDEGCGIKDRTSLSKALKSLEAKGLVNSEKGVDEKGENVTTVYSIRWKESTGGVVGNSYHPSRATIPPVVGQPYPQDTVLQETDLQYRNSKVKIQRNVSNKKQGYQSFKAIGDLLKQKTEQVGREEQRLPESIKAGIDEISQEFNDTFNRHSNRTHALHIYQTSRKTAERFTSYLYEARSITKQQGSVKNKMPYFFRVLEDITGLQKREGNTLPDASVTPQNALQQKFFSETEKSSYHLSNRNQMRQRGIFP